MRYSIVPNEAKNPDQTNEGRACSIVFAGAALGR